MASALVSLILAALVVMGSPGPATLSVTALGAAFGFRRSLRYLAGVVIGTTAVLIAVAAGVVAMLVSIPRAAPVLLALSAAYMIYLAFKIATAPPLSRLDPATRAPSLAGGLLLGVANPKAYVAIAAVFTSSTLAVASRLSEALLKTAVLTVMIVVIHVFWLAAGVSLSRLLHHPTSARLLNLGFAAVLVAATGLAIAGN